MDDRGFKEIAGKLDTTLPFRQVSEEHGTRNVRGGEDQDSTAECVRSELDL